MLSLTHAHIYKQTLAWDTTVPLMDSSILSSSEFTQKEIATHSSILAWEILWAEEPGGLWSTGSQESDPTQQQNHHHQV